MKKILIVEDETILLKVLKDRFKADGWDVSTAEDGEEAVELMEKNSFDLVLLDLMLPKKDGFQVLKEVKGHTALKSLPIIVLSNLGDDDDIKRALSLGASDYFVKTQHPIGEVIEKAKEFVQGGGKKRHSRTTLS
ncbi:MAG: response regulator [Candidatus Paceibacterota bacterium]